MCYEEFIDLVYAHVGVERASFKVNISLYYQFQGISKISLIRSDESLDTIYFLAEKDENYWGQVRVEVEKISHGQPKNSVTVDVLGNLRGLVQTHDDRFENDDDIRVNEPQINEGNSESLSNVEDASKHNVKRIQLLEDGGDTGDDGMAEFEDSDNSDIWSESLNKIRVGMQFESNLQVKKAITLWSIAQHREFKVMESKSSMWTAKCKSLEQEEAPHCEWYVRAITKKNKSMWQITRWVDHNCIGSCIGNNNRNLNSATIASLILETVEKDVSCLAKKIQADIKKRLNVDISYDKAWNGRRKAICKTRKIN
ncbi:MULE transposase domain-containing protein [Artemisia annua]|uniref:MULE transposase domain-containing protein n=1 Tax=Artemisia annua TaxID=35608 RepID=A0A2U1NJR3_ARTAN|nr:MULE transposase domain-containing protein [Artemisia annua]